MLRCWRMRAFTVVVAVVALLCAPSAAEETVTLRFATLAPEGTAWAREFLAAARDTELFSDGELKIRWVFGGIAGDENMVPMRMRRGQIDGEAASITCA